MDQLILAQKLESLRRCIKRVEEKTPSRIDFLVKDPGIQDILVLNLTRAVQLCVLILAAMLSAKLKNQRPPPWGMFFQRWKNLQLSPRQLA